MSKQKKYFFNGKDWFCESGYRLDKFEENIMLKETEYGQMLWPYYDKHEYRTDIRYKIIKK